MSDFNNIIFGKKTFSDILKDIYDNSKKTEKQISDLISNLGNNIDGPGSAAILVPLIVQYLDVKVKNDEHLVKMAAIVQRAITTKSNDSGELMLSPEEERDLIESAKALQNKGDNLKIPLAPPLIAVSNES